MKYVQCSVVNIARYYRVILIKIVSFNDIIPLHKIVIEKSINALTYHASHNLIYRACYEIYWYIEINISTLCDASLYVFYHNTVFKNCTLLIDAMLIDTGVKVLY